MSFTRILEPTITGGWNTGTSYKTYTATWEYPSGISELIIGRLTDNSYLELPDSSTVPIPSSGYTQFYVDIYLYVAKASNFVISSRTVDLSTFADGVTEYFQGPGAGEIYKAGCSAGEWASNSGNLRFRLYSNGNLTLNTINPDITLSVTLSGGSSKAKVTSVLIVCGLKARTDSFYEYVFDGINTPNGTLTPTLNHTWSEYNTGNCPSIVYYGKTSSMYSEIPVRYELLATDATTDVISYTIPFLRNHFVDYGIQITTNHIYAYKTSAKTVAILNSDIQAGTNYTVITINISDFSNGRGTAGSAIYFDNGTPPPTHIAYFYWDNNDGSLDPTLIDTGKTISTGLTAASWTRLQAKCREVQTAFGLSPSTFTTVHTGDLILASYYMEIRNALARLPSAAVPVLPPSVATGDVIRAYLFNGNVSASLLSLKFVLNAAISYYNDNY